MFAKTDFILYDVKFLGNQMPYSNLDYHILKMYNSLLKLLINF